MMMVLVMAVTRLGPLFMHHFGGFSGRRLCVHLGLVGFLLRSLGSSLR